MNYAQFREKLRATPRVWHVDKAGLRAGCLRLVTEVDGCKYCPVTAVLYFDRQQYLPPWDYLDAATTLDLPPWLAKALARAADNNLKGEDEHQSALLRELRADLLADCEAA